MEGEALRDEQLDELLTKYTDEKLLLGKLKTPEFEIGITKDDLLHMTLDEINGWRYDLSQYIINLQKEINRHKSISTWAFGALRVYLGIKANNYAAFSFEEKKMMAMEHDNYAKRLNKLALESEAAHNRVEYLPSKFETMLKIASDIAWSKRERQNSGESNN